MKPEGGQDISFLDQVRTFFASIRFQPSPAQLQQHDSSKAVLFVLDGSFHAIFCRIDKFESVSTNSFGKDIYYDTMMTKK